MLIGFRVVAGSHLPYVLPDFQEQAELRVPRASEAWRWRTDQLQVLRQD